MIQFTRILPAMLLSASIMLVLETPVRAGHRSPLECAAEQYRETVREFERLVRRRNYVDRVDERLVDDLENSTSRLTSASRNLRRADRLIERFALTERLHWRVETAFFTRTPYPIDPELEECWILVVRSYENLGAELNRIPAFCTSRRAGHSHRAAYQSPTYRRQPVSTGSRFRSASIGAVLQRK